VQTTSKSPKLSMEQSAAALLKLGISSNTEFRNLCSSGGRPDFIPSSPQTYYDNFPGWKAYMQLGKAYLLNSELNELKPDYQEVKKAIRRLNISSIAEYKKAVITGRLGSYAPEDPEQFFKDEFEGWGALLAPKHRKILSFEEARIVARKLWPTNSSEWRIFCRNGERPPCLPALPDREYAEEGWAGWKDFLNEQESEA